MISYSNLRDLIGKRGLTLKFFLEKIGMTRPGFEPAILNETVSAKVLQKMAEVLNVPVSYFFNETEAVSTKNIGSRGNKTPCLVCLDKERTLRHAEETISLQRDKIAYMERENSNLQDDLSEAEKENARLQRLVASGAAKLTDAA